MTAVLDTDARMALTLEVLDGGFDDIAERPGVGLSRDTARELDVLSQVALGCTNAEAAARLSLSVETVKAYLRNASAKLGAKGRHAAVSRARVLGLIP